MLVVLQTVFGVRLKNTDLSLSSLQCGLLSPAEISFTPESLRSLLLRSSSLRLDALELRTDARASQLLSDKLQPLSLKKHEENLSFSSLSVKSVYGLIHLLVRSSPTELFWRH